MPNLPKPRPRPWNKTSPEKKAHQGRKVRNPFYQTMPWRRFRAQEKKEAIAQTERIMRKLIAEEKPVPLVVQQLEPICAECLRGTVILKAKYTLARTLDHIKPINPANAYDTQNGRFGEPLDPNNTEFSCDAHHARKSGAEHKFHR